MMKVALSKWVFGAVLLCAAIGVLSVVTGIILSAEDDFSPPLLSLRAGLILFGIPMFPLALALLGLWYYIPWNMVEFAWMMWRTSKVSLDELGDDLEDGDPDRTALEQAALSEGLSPPHGDDAPLELEEGPVDSASELTDYFGQMIAKLDARGEVHGHFLLPVGQAETLFMTNQGEYKTVDEAKAIVKERPIYEVALKRIQ